MSGDQGNELESFDRLFDPASSEAERAALEVRLAASPRGRRLAAIHAALTASAPDFAPEPVVSAVMARLPAGTPRIYGALAEAVLRAWEEPFFRERLRSAPAAVLTEAGVHLPPGTTIVVVAPAAVALPDGLRVTLPLPERGSPAVPAAAALEALGTTPFAWLWGPPWARAPRVARARAAEFGQAPARATGGGLRRLLGGPAQGWRAAPALAVVGVAALVFVVAVTWGQEAGTVAGAAVSRVPGGVFAAGAAITALVGLAALWWARRGGR